MLFLYALFLFIIGHILEIMSFSENGAFTALKLQYIGSVFSVAFFLCFVLDYCGIKMRKLISILLFSVPAFIVVLFWTTSSTGLIYAAQWWDESQPIYKLGIEHGLLYRMPHIYSLLCAIATFVFLIRYLRKWDKQYKRLLQALLTATILSIVGDLMIMLSSNTFNSAYVNFTPYTLTAVAVISFLVLLQENIIDLSSAADVQVLDTISDAYLLFDGDLKLVDCNKTAERMFTISKPQSINQNIDQLAGMPESVIRFIKHESEENAGLAFTLEQEQLVYCEASVSEIASSNGKNMGFIIIVRDVTETQILMEKLRETAYHDALTGLFNRRRFMELAQSLCKQQYNKNSGTCFAMIMDIDFFKKVNDTYGHLAGDAVLRSVSGRIKNAVRESDLLARYGGEEFVVFVEKGELSEVLDVAERIRTDVEEGSCTYEETLIRNTISIGVAVCTQDTIQIDELLKSADEALYQAKEGGRNRVVLLK
ncbi:hypothetical protein FACS1894111_12670 [Clostridia bacterium]|nr:hypothetical protein FACS1894111_12670 [Clostridia bacterium]